jgi:catechol 2,3-dioxygenase-like lactoylglutathione lyase family enzyme
MEISAARPESTAILQHAEPQLFVADLEAAFGFYVGRLGFDIAFSHGEPPFYAQVRRGGARLNLRLTGRPAFDPEFRRAEPDSLSATIAVDDVHSLFLEFERQEVDFHQRFRAEPWGARTFITRDPGGNLICFAGAMD